MIKPTVGRILWYQPRFDEFNGVDGGDQPLAAIVTHVITDRTVNLCVFNSRGVPTPRIGVRLIQENETRPTDGYFCEWMPYQKGQAAKTEELERKPR